MVKSSYSSAATKRDARWGDRKQRGCLRSPSRHAGTRFQQARPTLFVLDGAKALHSAVLRTFGDRAVIQGCLAHKKRNVESYIPKESHAELRRTLNAAWAMTAYADATRAVKAIVRWLRNISDSAANSLEEGLEEMLTVYRIAPSTTGILCKTLLTTNPIESIFGQAADLVRRVKRWRGNEMVMRWLGSSLIWIEPRFRRDCSYKQLPELKRFVQTHQALHSKAV